MSAGNSRVIAKGGYVQGLNNHIQSTGQSTSKILYDAREGARDQFTVTLTLPSGASFTGTALGKQAAKEEAAFKALRSLGKV